MTAIHLPADLQAVPTVPADVTSAVQRHNDPGFSVLRLCGAFAPSGWIQLAGMDSALPAGLRALDFTEVTHCETGLEDAASFGRHLARRALMNGQQPIYVLIAPGDLLFGLCRRVQMHLDQHGLKVGVFRTLPTAVDWLRQEKLLPAQKA